MNPDEKLSKEELHEFFQKLIGENNNKIKILADNDNEYVVEFMTKTGYYLISGSPDSDDGILSCRWQSLDGGEASTMIEGPLNFWTWLSILHEIISNELLVHVQKEDIRKQEKDPSVKVDQEEIEKLVDPEIDKDIPEKVDTKEIGNNVLKSFSENEQEVIQKKENTESVVDPNRTIKKTIHKVIDPQEQIQKNPVVEQSQRSPSITPEKLPGENQLKWPPNEERETSKEEQEVIDSMIIPHSPWSTGKKSWGK